MPDRLLPEHQERVRLAEYGLSNFADGVVSGAYSNYLLVEDKQTRTLKWARLDSEATPMSPNHSTRMHLMTWCSSFR